MVDYGGKMPELQEHLCSLLKLCRKVQFSIVSNFSIFVEWFYMILPVATVIFHIEIVHSLLSEVNEEIVAHWTS